MSAVPIAGCSGAGKSTIAAELTRRGLVSIDTQANGFGSSFQCTLDVGKPPDCLVRLVVD